MNRLQKKEWRGGGNENCFWEVKGVRTLGPKSEKSFTAMLLEHETVVLSNYLINF